MYNTDFFISESSRFGVQLSEHMVSQFIKYYEILKEWNSFMNLTAITEFDEVVQKHFIDSISIVHAISISDLSNELLSSFNSSSLIDVGTGAGFPGIPLKIIFPELKVTLLDSLAKRVKFLNEVVSVLGLSGIDCIHGRAEEYAVAGKLREKFDFCVSRAVANLSTLSEYCIPFVKEGGFFIPYKSEKGSDEIAAASNAIKILGGNSICSSQFYLDDDNNDLLRNFYFIRKDKCTPKKYPRKSGTPSKEPL